MKTVLSLSVAVAVASFAASVSLVSAADTQVTVYSGSAAVSLPASMPNASPVQPKIETAKNDTAPVRNVRIVLQSPFGN